MSIARPRNRCGKAVQSPLPLLSRIPRPPQGPTGSNAKRANLVRILAGLRTVPKTRTTPEIPTRKLPVPRSSCFPEGAAIVQPTVPSLWWAWSKRRRVPEVEKVGCEQWAAGKIRGNRQFVVLIMAWLGRVWRFRADHWLQCVFWPVSVAVRLREGQIYRGGVAQQSSPRVYLAKPWPVRTSAKGGRLPQFPRHRPTVLSLGRCRAAEQGFARNISELLWIFFILFPICFLFIICFYTFFFGSDLFYVVP